MTISNKFYELDRDEQEVKAVEIANAYYALADKWKKVAIKARTGTLEKPKKQLNEKIKS